MMDFLRRANLGFGVGVAASDPLNAFSAFRRGMGDDPLGAVRDAYQSGGIGSAFGAAFDLGRAGFTTGIGRFGAMMRGIPAGFTGLPGGLGARVGFGAGVGMMLGGPIIAGAAAFSGLNNLRRGRYGRAAWQLALGAGLVGSIYMAHNRLGAMPASPPPHDYQI